MFQLKRPTETPAAPGGITDMVVIKSILAKLYAKWYLFAIGFVIGLAIALFQIKTATQIYALKGVLLLGDPADKNTTTAMLEGIGISVPTTGVEEEIALIKSSNTIRKALEDLDFNIGYFHEHRFKTTELYGNGPFKVVLDSTKNQMSGLSIYVKMLSKTKYQVRAKGENVKVFLPKSDEVVDVRPQVLIDEVRNVGQPFNHPDLNFRIEFSRDAALMDQGEYSFRIYTLESLVNKYQKKLSVKPAGKETKVVELYSNGASIAMEKKFLNQVMYVYIQNDLEEILDKVESSIAFLDEEIAKTTGTLEQSAMDVARAGGSSNLMNLAGEGANITSQLASLESRRSDLRIQVQYYEEISRKLASGNVEVASPTSLNINDPILTSLILELSALNRKLAEDRRDLTPNHPSISVSEVKLENARNAALGNVNTNLSATRNALNEIERRIAELKGEKYSLAGREFSSGTAEIQQSISTSDYEKLLETRRDMAMRMSSIRSDKKVIEWGKLMSDGPVYPNPLLIMIIFVGLGLGIPLGFIVVKEFMDDRIKGTGDIESNTSIPVLGFIAKHDKNSNYIVEKHARTPVAESFRAVRIKLQYLETSVEKQVIGLTSSSSGEGKTFCIANLAAIYAQAGKRVLVMDVDLRRPRVGRYFEFKDQRGLSNYLSGEVDNIFTLVQPTHVENLDVLGSGPIASNPLDLLSSARMTEMLAQLRQHYDHIFLDTPPLGMVSDYLVLMTMTDFNIYIVRHERTNVDSLNYVNQLYESGKIKNLGILINDVKSLSAYGYIDRYYGYGDEDEA